MKKHEEERWGAEFLRLNRCWFLMGLCLLAGMIILAGLYELDAEILLYLCSLVIIGMCLAGSVAAVRFRKEKRAQMAKREAQIPDTGEEAWREVHRKEDFFALWAHQIKTPIAALGLLLQSEEIDRSAGRNELFKIESYVEMALGYLRFEGISSDLVLERCSLDGMVRQVVKKHAPIFIGKHLAVSLNDLEYAVLTDEKWFCFVLEQILSNALKYTMQGGVRIYADPGQNRNADSAKAWPEEKRCDSLHSEQAQSYLTLCIEDTGIGIRKEDLPRLFEKGFTGYNGRMDKKASGLGLYLAKGVCDKLGLGITIESEEGKGTCVKIKVRHENVRQEDLRAD